MMIKYLFLLFLPFLVNSQVVSNVRLVDHFDYFVKVMQEMINEAERGEWCNLKVPTITNNIDSDIYGWHVVGVANYTNGFVKSIGMINLVDSTIQQIWTHSTTTETTSVNVQGTLSMNEVAVGFDVEAELNGEKHFYTGVFEYTLLQFRFSIIKDMNTGVITTIPALITIQPGTTRRMQYLPASNLTQVLSRSFIPALANIQWASQIFNPILVDLVTTKIQFPEVCYHCSA